jgi:hypothetical protein
MFINIIRNRNFKYEVGRYEDDAIVSAVRRRITYRDGVLCREITPQEAFCNIALLDRSGVFYYFDLATKEGRDGADALLSLFS